MAAVVAFDGPAAAAGAAAAAGGAAASCGRCQECGGCGGERSCRGRSNDGGTSASNHPVFAHFRSSVTISEDPSIGFSPNLAQLIQHGP